MMSGVTTIVARGDPAGTSQGHSVIGRAIDRVWRGVRRPYDWARRPWPDERIVKTAVTAATLIVTTFIAMQVVHFNPLHWLGIGGDDLIFRDTTPTGGDMGAHVWAPAYLRDELLPHWQLSGWSMDWYAGLPVYRFYMVVPALAIVGLDLVLPYGVAFKLVAISGIVSLPFCCWAFGRLARFRYPLPELFAFAGLCFVLNESYSIMGGNVMSTMAGEFSFSIAVSLMMLGLGFLARGLDTGRFPTWAAVFLMLACLSHGIVLIYTMITALILVVCRCGADLWRVFTKVIAGEAGVVADGAGRRFDSRTLVYGLLMVPASLALTVLLAQLARPFYYVTVVVLIVALVAVAVLSHQVGGGHYENALFRRRLLYAAVTGALTLALSAFWVGPFLANHQYMTDMKYAPYPESAGTTYWAMLFDQKPFFNVLINTLALAGLVAAIVRRHVYGIALALSTVAAGAMVYLAHDSLPRIGLLWNPRVLPWLYLMRYLLMMYGGVEVGTVIVNFVRDRRARAQLGLGGRTALGAIGALAVLLVFGWLYQWLPGATTRYVGPSGENYEYAWGPFTAADAYGDGWTQSDGWAAYNFNGYEGVARYPELYDLVQTMQGIGDDRGCGRALWERTDNLYGTPMALMLLPYWTDGCIASSEGLYFEASGTTPYHFITADAMSGNAYTPVRQLRETVNDASVGVPYLQDLGIEYLMVESPEAIAQAETQADLVPITTSGPWHIYQVRDAPVVEALTVEPVVVNARSGDPRECYLEIGTSWFQNRGDWAALPATSGPDSWQRIDVAADPEQMYPLGQPTDRCGDPTSTPDRRVNIVKPVQEIEARPLPEVEVSNVDIGEQSVSFDVSQVGVPVLVKVSYFPNWQVSGADGPYRVAPNFMVVVPTDTHVELTYGRSSSDLFFYGVTFLGIVGALVLRIKGPIRYPAPPVVGLPAGPVPAGDPGRELDAALALAGIGPPPGPDPPLGLGPSPGFEPPPGLEPPAPPVLRHPPELPDLADRDGPPGGAPPGV